MPLKCISVYLYILHICVCVYVLYIYTEKCMNALSRAPIKGCLRARVRIYYNRIDVYIIYAGIVSTYVYGSYMRMIY